MAPGSLPGKFRGQGNLAGYSPLVCKELDTIEQCTHIEHLVVPQCNICWLIIQIQE